MTQKAAKPVTEEILRSYIDGALKTIDVRFDRTEKKFTEKIDTVEKNFTAKMDTMEKNLTAKIEARVEDSKKDLREQIASVQKGIVRIEEELKYVQQAVRETREELSDKIDTIGARLDDHESKPANIAHKAA